MSEEKPRNFSAKIAPHAKDSCIMIDGESLPNTRGFTITSHLDSGVSRINVEMLALKPFEVNGQGVITVDARVVDVEIARKVYESLKAIFECPNKATITSGGEDLVDASIQGSQVKQYLPSQGFVFNQLANKWKNLLCNAVDKGYAYLKCNQRMTGIIARFLTDNGYLPPEE
jgi:hypothetical protein